MASMSRLGATPLLVVLAVVASGWTRTVASGVGAQSDACGVCESLVSRVKEAVDAAADGSDLTSLVEIDSVCVTGSESISPSRGCEQFWEKHGLSVLSLLEVGEERPCSHRHIDCASERWVVADDAHDATGAGAVNSDWPPLPVFIELDEQMLARERAEMRTQDALESKLLSAMGNKAQGVPQDVSSYEAAKALSIHDRMKDLLERYRRNAARLQSFRESLLSMLQVGEPDTAPLSADVRARLTTATLALLEVGSQTDAATAAGASLGATAKTRVRATIATSTGDIDDTLDRILAIIHECKKIGDTNALRLKDVRGSLTSMIELDSEVAPLPAREGGTAALGGIAVAEEADIVSLLQMAISEAATRAGSTEPPLPETAADDDLDDVARDHLMDDEMGDMGTIPMGDPAASASGAGGVGGGGGDGRRSGGDGFFQSAEEHFEDDQGRNDMRHETGGDSDGDGEPDDAGDDYDGTSAAATGGDESHHHHQHRHHSHHRHGHGHTAAATASSPSAEALNHKLDEVLGTVQHIMLTNQDSSIRLKKIDKVGDLVDKLIKMSKDYSDSISSLRGQFLSFLEVDAEEAAVASLPTSAAAPRRGRHALGGRRGRDADADAIVGSQEMLQEDDNPENSEEGKLFRRLHPGGKATAGAAAAAGATAVASSSQTSDGYGDDGGDHRADDDDRAIANGVQAPEIDDDDDAVGGSGSHRPASSSAASHHRHRRHRSTANDGGAENEAYDGTDADATTARHRSGGSRRNRQGNPSSHRSHRVYDDGRDDGSSGSDGEEYFGKGGGEGRGDGEHFTDPADGLLMQEHEHRMDEVVDGLEDLVTQMEQNFERVHELKRELDLFVQVDQEVTPLTPEERTAAGSDAGAQAAAVGTAGLEDGVIAAGGLDTTVVADTASALLENQLVAAVGSSGDVPSQTATEVPVVPTQLVQAGGQMIEVPPSSSPASFSAADADPVVVGITIKDGTSTEGSAAPPPPAAPMLDIKDDPGVSPPNPGTGIDVSKLPTAEGSIIDASTAPIEGQTAGEQPKEEAAAPPKGQSEPEGVPVEAPEELVAQSNLPQAAEQSGPIFLTQQQPLGDSATTAAPSSGVEGGSNDDPTYNDLLAKGGEEALMLDAGFTSDIVKDIEFLVLQIEDVRLPQAGTVSKSSSEAAPPPSSLLGGDDAPNAGLKQAVAGNIRSHDVVDTSSLLDGLRDDLKQEDNWRSQVPATAGGNAGGGEPLLAKGADMSIEAISLMQRCRKRMIRLGYFIRNYQAPP